MVAPQKSLKAAVEPPQPPAAGELAGLQDTGHGTTGQTTTKPGSLLAASSRRYQLHTATCCSSLGAAARLCCGWQHAIAALPRKIMIGRTLLLVSPGYTSCLLQTYGRVAQLQSARSLRQSADASATASAQPAAATAMGLAVQASCMPREQQQLVHFLLLPVLLFWVSNLPDVFLDDAPSSASALCTAITDSSNMGMIALYHERPACPWQLPSSADEAVQQAVLQDVLQSASQLGTKLLRQLQECRNVGLQQAADRLRLQSVLGSTFVLVQDLARLADASQHCMSAGHAVDLYSGSVQHSESSTSSRLTSNTVTSSSSSSSDNFGMPALHSVSSGSTVMVSKGIGHNSGVNMDLAWVPHAATIGKLLEADIRLHSRSQTVEHYDMSLGNALMALCLGHRHTGLGEADSTQQTSQQTCATGTERSAMTGLVMTAPLYLAAVSAGGDSTEQQQLFCMMCSVFKAGAQQPSLSWTSWQRWWYAAACLVEAFTVNARQQSTAKAVAMVPWLVLMGRSWLHLAVRVNGSQAAGSSRDADTSSGLAVGLQEQKQQQQTPGVAGCAQADLAQVTDAVGKAVHGAKQVLSWLQSSGVAAALAAAGYLTDNICSQLQQLAEQGSQLQAASGGLDPAVLSAITSHLQAAGLSLCTLPLPYACNNPHCTNLSGLSERHLVNGRSCMCGGCRVARYCSKACQQQHWKQHKRACKAMAAACIQD